MYERTAHFYDFFSDDEGVLTARNFLEPYLLEAKNILEIGPGTGHLLFELAKYANVVAYEPSSALMSLLLAKIPRSSDLERRCTLFSAMLDLPSSLFDVAIARNVLFLLSDDEKLSLFQALAGKLAANGSFIFNFSNSCILVPEKQRSLIGERSIGRLKYLHYSESKNISEVKRKVMWQFDVLREGHVIERFKEEFLIYQSTSLQLIEMLRSAGFRDFGLHAGFVGGEFKELEHKQPVVVARF